MKKIFLVFSLLALSGENVFGVDTPESLNAESCKEGQVENQHNLDVTDVASGDSDEQSRKRKRDSEEQKPIKRARTDQFKVEQAIEHHVGIFQNDFTSTSTSTGEQPSELPGLFGKRVHEIFPITQNSEISQNDSQVHLQALMHNSLNLKDPLKNVSAKHSSLKKHAVLGCYELTQRILCDIPHIDQGGLREVVDYFQYPYESSSFTYTQETQQKIQQEIKDGSTNPGGYRASYITELTLGVKPQSEEEWRALDQKFPNIHVLNAEHFLMLKPEDISSLVKCFPRLTSLNLSINQIGDEDAQVLATNTTWNLQTLDLSKNEIGCAGAEAIAANTSWNLQTLDLSNNQIGDTGAQAIAANTSWNLQTLHLSQNKIEVAGAQALAANTSWNLQTLNLSMNKIGDAGAQALAANTSWNLQTLALIWNQIGDEGAQALAGNTSWNLQTLHLSVGYIGDAGAQALAANTSWNLQTLDLWRNQIGVAGIQALRNSPYLRSTRVTY